MKFGSCEVQSELGLYNLNSPKRFETCLGGKKNAPFSLSTDIKLTLDETLNKISASKELTQRNACLKLPQPGNGCRYFE